MRGVVKICGLTTPEAVAHAVASGATAVGLVLATSPRRVDPTLAAELLAAAGAAERVAVFRVPSPEALAAIAALPFDAVQADAGWDGALPDGWFRVPAFHDRPADHAALHAGTWAPATPGSLRGAFLLDGPRGGGLGELGDARRAARAAAHGPCVLAGGLDPENVGALIAAVRPHGVDVSSGVEAAPGVKDPARVAAFIAAAHAAFAALSAQEHA